ncbi:MAG: type II toxin-antitoxin system YoeB family toxin [Bacteroidales bacterium]|nr:type II toxin-antitoxin system YoeB family toxin [Bacteroidales bacterium]
MELVCNELSFFPLADNKHIAEERFKTIIRTFREAKLRYDFSHIRFPKSYSAQQITSTQTLFEWISTLSNQTLKTLILTLFKPPFTDDLEETEMNKFFESNYIIASEDAPERNSPVGLPIAFIKSLPSISFNSHPFWQNRKIGVRKINTNETENLDFITYNICFEADLGSNEFIEWTDKFMSVLINSTDVLIKYLGFTKYQVEFTTTFMEQLFEWKIEDFRTYKYVLLLMKDVQVHPFTGGMGQTENLKGRGKEASKRVTQPDRLSYKLENDIIKFIACKGHYKFH